MEIAYLLPGQERYTSAPDKGGADRIQYSYRSERGDLFSCVCKTLDDAQERCEDWLLRQERY